MRYNKLTASELTTQYLYLLADSVTVIQYAQIQPKRVPRKYGDFSLLKFLKLLEGICGAGQLRRRECA